MRAPLGRHLAQSALVLAGTLLFGLGIQLQLFSGAGVDPLTMFEEGMGITTGIATGTIALGVNCVMLLLALLLNRKNIWAGTVITVFCLGPSINLFAGLMAGMGMLPPAGWLGKLAMNVAGVFLCGAGIAIYMLPDYGVGAMEAVMIFLAEKLRLPYGPVRIAMDCTWGVAGFFLGGTLGVGTIIGAFGIGISLDLCLRGLKKTLGKAIPAGK